MFYFSDRYDAFLASQMALMYMETLIYDASAMTYCFCIPRDMNHPISDLQSQYVYIMVTHTLHKYLSLITSPWLPISFYMETLICDGLPMDRRYIASTFPIMWKHAYGYMETSLKGACG